MVSRLGAIGRCLIGLVMVTSSVSLLAADRAILVGVNAYPHLAKRLALGGAVNDARSMRQWLGTQGWQPEAFRVLTAPQGEGEALATLAAIEAAMQEALAQAKPGDRVLLYLAGHGAQQPNPAEADGLDEVFLPTDAAPWNGRGSTQVHHALVDDAIGNWMDTLVDKGARVFGIFDTCHAVGMTRSSLGRSRAVTADDLGLPPPIGIRTNPAALTVRTDGRWLAFATRAGGTTTEAWVPMDAPLSLRRIRGTFTVRFQAAVHGAKSAPDVQRRLLDAYKAFVPSAAMPLVVSDPKVQW